MTKRLTRVAPLQLGIVLAVLYGLISLIFIPFFVLAMVLPDAQTGHHGGLSVLAGGIMAIVFPIIYAALGFIGGVIVAFVYNFVATFTGGIEFTFADVPTLP